MSQAHNRITAYHWYLGSAFWRERREHILELADHIWEKCGKWGATEVHHLKYISVYQEHPSDLIALCRPCHSEIHWRQPANDNQRSPA
jgi:5-methylcytosine-specific restriction endonuclease McrA